MDRLLTMGEGKTRRRLAKMARQINDIEPDYEEMSDSDLRAQTDDFKARLADGETLDDILPEAFATVREAAKRVLNKRHFDVQLMGGIALHECNIAEMKTGEGKTLVATLPSYLNALNGKGVHIITVNDYLARYQSEQMGRVHHFLGLETGVILSNMTPAERREAYNADITYGTNNEFGFDYLRDNMALSQDDCVQRGHQFAIVDEVDSILIDEARTPLIISGPAEDNHEWYPEFARLVTRLKRNRDYEVDETKRTVSILAPGIEAVEDRLGIDNLYESANTPLIGYLNNAIKAKELFLKDRDYVILDGEVLIVDEHTGRTLTGRRYNEGLHQALEAKEGVEIKDEYQTLATITLQNYFRMYQKLAGMTGTAKTEESEFQKIYGLGVIPIPTNMPMIRVDQKDQIFRTEEAKFDAIIADVVERHEEGQPILIGTASVAKSERLSTKLKKAGVPHKVLNAKHHESEAAIIALAGRKGAVTVATNMAGRGTDIILGGNPEFMADLVLRDRGLDPVESPEDYEAAWDDTLADLEAQVADEHEEVTEAGGLFVIGSERHESRRIDNQLRGRSGRQGDPGESRFYLSLEDELMRLFKADVVERAMLTMRLPDDQPIEHRIISNAIESAQKQVEAQNFDMRKNVLKYDDVMNRQRHAIYADRRQVLEGADVEEQLRDTVKRVVTAGVHTHTEGFADEWDLDALWAQMSTLFPVTLVQADFEGVDDAEELVDAFTEDADAAYDKRQESLGEETMRELERQVLLTVLDRKWREHLYEMDYLREGIGLRAMAQRDPLVEYQREGGAMFNAMMEAFMEEVVGYLFNLEVTTESPEVGLVGDGSTPMVLSGPDEGGNAAALRADDDEPDDAGTQRTRSTSRAGRGQAGGRSGGGRKAGAKSNKSNTDSVAGSRGSGDAGASRSSLRAKGLATGGGPKELNYSAGDGQGGTAKSAEKKKDAFSGVGRNQQCPCGSGRKFKACHGKPAQAS